LAAFTGMRLNEISQLLVADVIQHSDTLWLISVSDDKSLPSAGESTEMKLQKRLKNRASRRKVSVHSKLIELGFLEFVTARKAAGNDTLFDLQLDSRDGMGQSVGRKFATYLRDKVGITDRRKVSPEDFSKLFS
jgi:integrase